MMDLLYVPKTFYSTHNKIDTTCTLLFFLVLVFVVVLFIVTILVVLLLLL